MVPLRVTVEGFMSYRERAVLDFQGARLWALAGDNGAGKSAIFDAITFVLYGLHRGGKQGAPALINQQSDKLIVEYDFAINSDVYCVKRTVPRRGRSTYQAFSLGNLSNYQDNEFSPRAIPETDTDSKLEQWVRALTGLDVSTFTSAVLLQQGKSDALLNARGAAKHEILSQIIDLSAYKTLHQRADERHKDFARRRDAVNKQIAEIEPTNEEEIAIAADAVNRANLELRQIQQLLEQLAALKIHAKRWGELIVDHESLQRSVQEVKSLFEQVERIEREAARLAELERVLPKIEHLIEERSRLTLLDKQIAQYRERASEWEATLKQAQKQLQTASVERATLQERKAALEEQRNNALESLRESAPTIAELDELERTRQSIAVIDESLAKFPLDLDEQLEHLQAEMMRLAELKTAQPWLERFADARAAWHAANQREKETTEALAAVEEQIAEHKAKQKQVTQDVDMAEVTTARLRSEVIVAKTKEAEVQNQLNRFHQLDGLSECSYCGQRLTSAHVEKENERLEEALRTAQADARQAEEEFQQASSTLRQRQQTAQELANQLQSLEKERQGYQQQQRDAQRDCENANKDGLEARGNLPERFEAQISASTPDNAAAPFAGYYPSSADVETLRVQVTQYQSQEQAFRTLQLQEVKHARLRAQSELLETRVLMLEKKYPQDQIAALRRGYDATEAQVRDVKQALNVLEPLLNDVEVTYLAADKAVMEAEDAKSKAASEADKRLATRGEIERTVEQLVAALPEPWRDIGRNASAAGLATWQTEVDSLAGATERYVMLEGARNKQATDEQRLSQIERELQEIPTEARRAVAELEEKEKDGRNRQQEADKQRSEAEDKLRELTARKVKRSELEAELKGIERRVSLYGELARYLGRDYLQRHLLQQAEIQIVQHANDVLDRISGGTLRLELQSEAGDGSKALDLVAYNTETGYKPLPAFLLSGGQRFRVAVSLALGIGQYASQGVRSMEAVIIDEGFGSLDQQGRSEIIEQLKELGTILQRVIIVSHQQEFANSFPNRYIIQIEDGTSRVSLSE